MIRFYTLLTFLISISSLYSQQDWQEHFSHDRSAYGHTGHFVIDGNLVLVMANWGGPMNTLETINGNTKKDVVIISPYNEYGKIKTTTTGIGEKEILFLMPWDYDIVGLGHHSVRLLDDSISIRSINLIEDDYPTLYDAYIPAGALETKEAITKYTKQWLTLDENDNIIGSIPTELFDFHETPNEVFQISGGILNPIFLPSDHPGNLTLGAYDRIDNDPFQNHIAVMISSEMRRYDAENGEFIRTDQLNTNPIDIKFTEDGFYFLAEDGDSYYIYKYTDELSQSEIWYELKKEDDVIDFRVMEFEIVGEDIYFMGLIERPGLLGFFSYVQKRNKNVSFAPSRKDLRLDTVYISGSPSGPEPWDFWNYEYGFQVTNTSDDTIHHFTVLSPGMQDQGLGPRRFVYQNIDQELAPGESYEQTGDFSYYEIFSLSLSIAGVDYGFDSNPDNDNYTADVMTLSSKDEELKVYSIGPNPSTKFLSIFGDMNDILNISVIDNASNIIKKQLFNLQYIEIDDLQKGHYWLQISTKNGIERHPFIKI